MEPAPVSDVQEAIVADVTRAARTEGSRISEISAKLGVEPRRTGRSPKRLSMEEAIRIVSVRRLQEVGVSLDGAVAALKQVSFETLKEVLGSDEPRFLAIAPDGEVSVCDVNGLAEFTITREGIRNLRIVNLRTVVEDVFAAMIERNEAAEAERAARSRVSRYTAGKGETGIYLHSDFRLAIFKDGKGMAFQLDPTIARELGQHLIRVADAAETPPTNEVVN
jgi:hypothetical protein